MHVGGGGRGGVKKGGDMRKTKGGGRGWAKKHVRRDAWRVLPEAVKLTMFPYSL